jgi:ribosomal protein S10
MYKIANLIIMGSSPILAFPNIMNNFNVIINSKNKKSLDYFFFFFSCLFQKNLSVIKSYVKIKKKRKVLTLLKSPHVNKSAQEQFEIRVFSKQINLSVLKDFQFLYLLKLIKNAVLTDSRVKSVFHIRQSLQKKILLNIFNPFNFSNSLDFQLEEQKLAFAAFVFQKQNLFFLPDFCKSKPKTKVYCYFNNFLFIKNSFIIKYLNFYKLSLLIKTWSIYGETCLLLKLRKIKYNRFVWVAQ